MCWLGSEEGDSDSPLVSSVIFFGDTGLGGGSGLVQCLYGERVRHISFVGIALERKMTSSNFRFFVQIANVTCVYQNLFREAQKKRVHKLSIGSKTFRLREILNLFFLFRKVASYEAKYRIATRIISTCSGTQSSESASKSTSET